jgi:hypothetical protein
LSAACLFAFAGPTNRCGRRGPAAARLTAGVRHRMLKRLQAALPTVVRRLCRRRRHRVRHWAFGSSTKQSLT